MKHLPLDDISMHRYGFHPVYDTEGDSESPRILGSWSDVDGYWTMNALVFEDQMESADVALVTVDGTPVLSVRGHRAGNGPNGRPYEWESHCPTKVNGSRQAYGAFMDAIGACALGPDSDGVAVWLAENPDDDPWQSPYSGDVIDPGMVIAFVHQVAEALYLADTTGDLPDVPPTGYM